MTPEELYDYITSQMTPEAALKKLLKGAILNYEKLKGQDDPPTHPEIIITMAAYDLGWHIALKNTDDEQVPGMIVGTMEYLEEVLKKKK